MVSRQRTCASVEGVRLFHSEVNGRVSALCSRTLSEYLQLGVNGQVEHALNFNPLPVSYRVANQRRGQ